jgi:ribosomal protein L37AE/L43A
MNSNEQIKAEIRLYKRFLDELDKRMNVKINYSILVEIAAQLGFPETVIQRLLKKRFIYVDEQNAPHPPSLLFGDTKPYHFTLTAEVDYRIADYVRMYLKSCEEQDIYYQSQVQKWILAELEREDSKLSRHCLRCDFPILERRADATYCCEKCRQQARRARRLIVKNQNVPEKIKTEKQNWFLRAWQYCFGK